MPVDLGMPMYSLNDVEEDDEYPTKIGKRYDSSNLVYTFTNRYVWFCFFFWYIFLVF